jgi:hypothetical protein
VLRLYVPAKGRFFPSHVLLETQLDQAILGLHAGPFTLTSDGHTPSLAVLHPRSIAFYDVQCEWQHLRHHHDRPPSIHPSIHHYGLRCHHCHTRCNRLLSPPLQPLNATSLAYFLVDTRLTARQFALGFSPHPWPLAVDAEEQDGSLRAANLKLRHSYDTAESTANVIFGRFQGNKLLLPRVVRVIHASRALLPPHQH